MCSSISSWVSRDDLLDAGRVDAAVLDQLLQRELGGLAADVVEARDDDDARRVVDDDVDAGGLLEGADVAALAADDPPLHVVGGDVDGADGGLGGVARRRSAGWRWRGPRGPSAGRSPGAVCSCLRIRPPTSWRSVVLEAAGTGPRGPPRGRGRRGGGASRAARPGPAGPRRRGGRAPPAARPGGAGSPRSRVPCG